MSDSHRNDGECSYSVNSEELSGEIDGYSCEKPDWKDADYCIWHTDSPDKPISELKASRAGEGERLDGAIINGIEFGNEISFSDCSLVNAQARDATFSEGINQRTDFRNADLRGTDFSSGNLVQAKFSGADLTRADFSNSSLNDVNFTNADLSQTDLSNANLREANLTNTDLSKTKLSGSRLEKADLSKADLSHRNLIGNKMVDADFSEASLRYTDFSKSNITRVNFSGSNLEDANLEEADASHSCFSGATLSRANCIGTDFEGGDLSAIEFTDGDATRAIFKDIVAEDAKFKRTIFTNGSFKRAKLNNADFEESNIQDANIKSAEAENVNLSFADLSRCIARDCSFKGANLENSNLTQADLRGTDLRRSLLYQVIVTDSRINNETKFGHKCRYETDPDTEIRFEENIERLQAAAWTYRRLESLYSSNSLAKQAYQNHIRKEEAKRAYYKEENQYLNYSISTINRWLTRHGEGLGNILVSSIFVILSWGALYPFAGGIRGDNGEIYRLHLCTCIGPEIGSSLLNSLYFSIATFTALGSNDYVPIGLTAKYLASFQSLLGALLVALFIFTLGRKVDR